MMNILPQLEEGLERAVQEQFCSLFRTLMVESLRDADGAWERFRIGVRRLAETEKTTSDILKRWQE